MKIEIVKKAKKLLEEIEELKKYKNIMDSIEYRSSAHFEIVQHYGNCKNYEKVLIERKHNDRLIAEINKIISELESELDAL